MRDSHRILVCLIFAAALTADDEASNWPHVAASRSGRCYAKSVPTQRYGTEGVTTIYGVGSADDHILHTYPWYSNPIHLECGVAGPEGELGASVVRFGPWARGRTATATELAIAFYFRGKLVKRYSTLDIAGDPDNVGRSRSHYSVIERVLGYRWTTGNSYVFEAVSSDGRKLVFDAATGEILSRRTTPAP